MDSRALFVTDLMETVLILEFYTMSFMSFGSVRVVTGF